MEIAKSPVKLSNISYSRNNDIVINRYSKLKPITSEEISFVHDPKMSSDAILTLEDLYKLAGEQIVSVKANVAHVSEVQTRPTQSGILPKQEVILRDTTKCCKPQLFGDDVDRVEEGKTYILKNLRVKISKNVRFLNSTKAEKFACEEVLDLDGVVDLDDIDSLTKVSMTAKIVGVHKVRKIFHCVTCNRKVEVSSRLAHCESCSMDMMISACTCTWYVRLLFIDVASEEKYHLSLGNGPIYDLLKVACIDNSVNKETSEDEMAKMILDIIEPLHIAFDSSDQFVKTVKKCC